MTLPIHALLPLRGLTITLRFTAPAQPGPVHQPALTAWLRHLVADLPGYEHAITLDTPENGRGCYSTGDLYRFTLFSAAESTLLQDLLERLRDLPRRVKVTDIPVPFRDNLMFVAAHDGFSGEPVDQVAQPRLYGEADLDAETAMWSQVETWYLRWLAPVRLLLPAAQREGQKGELRYCRHRLQLDEGLLRDRLHDSLAELLRRRGLAVEPRGKTLAAPLAADVFWVDFAYRNAQGQEKPMGGLLARCRWMPREWTPKPAVSGYWPTAGLWLGPVSTGNRRRRIHLGPRQRRQ